MIKQLLSILFLCVTTLLMGQSITPKKCGTCGAPLAKCQYKGQHPKIFVEDNCKKCGKPLSQCQYHGQHPVSKLEKKTGKQIIKEREVSFRSTSDNAFIYLDDSNKKWSINDHIKLSDGDHNVVVVASGYYNYSGTIKVDSNNTYFYFPLEIDNHITVTGTVKDSSRNPQTGIVVWAKTSNISATVDKQGCYQLDNVNPGEAIEVIVDGKKYTSKAQNIVDFIVDDKNIIKVKGLVLDKKGEPIIAANIRIKDSNKGTISDLDGKFMIEVPKNSELIVSFVGLKTQTLQAQPSMTIVLKKK